MTEDEAKARYLQRVIFEDAQSPAIIHLAQQLTGLAMGRQRLFIELAATLARWGILQRKDSERVGGEDIAGFTRAPQRTDPIEALERGEDDCDAKARLFCAVVIAGGGRARIGELWRGEVLAHVFAEVGLNREPVELTLARAQLGEHPLAVPKEKNGQWLETI